MTVTPVLRVIITVLSRVVESVNAPVLKKDAVITAEAEVTGAVPDSVVVTAVPDSVAVTGRRVFAFVDCLALVVFKKGPTPDEDEVATPVPGLVVTGAVPKLVLTGAVPPLNGVRLKYEYMLVVFEIGLTPEDITGNPDVLTPVPDAPDNKEPVVVVALEKGAMLESDGRIPVEKAVPELTVTGAVVLFK